MLRRYAPRGRPKNPRVSNVYPLPSACMPVSGHTSLLHCPLHHNFASMPIRQLNNSNRRHPTTHDLIVARTWIYECMTNDKWLSQFFQRQSVNMQYSLQNHELVVLYEAAIRSHHSRIYNFFCRQTSTNTLIIVSTHLHSTTRQQQQPTTQSPQMSSPGGPRRSSSRGSSPFFSACTGKSLENKVRWLCGKRKKKQRWVRRGQERKALLYGRVVIIFCVDECCMDECPSTPVISRVPVFGQRNCV